MALELPDWLTDAFNLIGLPWPGIDEDQLRAWATGVRNFANSITDTSSQTNRGMQQLAESSESSVITGAARQYESHHQLLVDLHGPIDDFAQALDLAADAVVAQKWIVIGAATALATEFTATQIGAIFTLGADEAAVPAEVISTQQIVKFALKDLEAVVIGKLINLGASELSDHVNRSIVTLANDAWGVHMETQGIKVAYDKIHGAAQDMHANADEVERAGRSAQTENTSRNLEDNRGAAGWAEVVNALRQGLLDIAVDLFKNLPATIAKVIRDLANTLESLANRLRVADDGSAPAPVADRPATNEDVPGDPYTPISAENGSQALFDRLFPGMGNVNAPRLHLGWRWQRNCQSCVVATDSTLDGHPASAVPVPLEGGFRWPDSVTKLAGGKPFVKVTGYNEITGQLLRAGDGARGVVWGRRIVLTGEGPKEIQGHVFNVVNRGGRVYYVDGQTGTFARLEHFSELQFLRTH